MPITTTTEENVGTPGHTIQPKCEPPVEGAARGSASLTYEEYQACLKEADERMKANNGHQYLHILKTRCMNCGRSPKVKTRCGGWFTTFVNILGSILQEKGVIVEKTPNVRVSASGADKPTI